jgi:hypothetical protein
MYVLNAWKRSVNRRRYRRLPNPPISEIPGLYPKINPPWGKNNPVVIKSDRPPLLTLVLS